MHKSTTTSSEPVTVKPVMSYRDMGQFIDVPWHVYADDPLWVPPLRLERRLHYSKKFNPYFKHGEWQAWVAYRGKQPVGRISAQIDTLHQERYGKDTGHFGALECVNDSEVLTALMMHAEAWLGSRQVRHVTGPYNLSINQECGVLVDGFDTPPVVMMPHSPKWYDALLVEQGYQAAKDLLAYWIGVDFEAPRVMNAIIKKFSKQITLRSLQRSNFEQEIETLRSIFNDAWSENWRFVPFTEAEFKDLGDSLRFLLTDDYIQIAEVDGEPAAFMVALPNINEVFAELNGSLLPFGWLKLMHRIKRNKIRTVRIPLMGVRKKYHNTPMGMALACTVIDAPRKMGIEKGIEEVEMSWILEDNKGMRSILESIGSEPYKRYRIYEKTLA